MTHTQMLPAPPTPNFDASLEGLSHQDLIYQRELLKQKNSGNYSAWPDDDLTKMVAINTEMRRRSAAGSFTPEGESKPRTNKPKQNILDIPD